MCSVHEASMHDAISSNRAHWRGETKEALQRTAASCKKIIYIWLAAARFMEPCVSHSVFYQRRGMEASAPLFHAYSVADGGPYALYRLPPGRQYRSASPPALLASVNR